MARKLSAEFPIHICARSNNRERFPVSIEEAWSMFDDYLFLLPKAFDIELINYVLMPNHFHLTLRDPQLRLPEAMEYFMRETSRELSRSSGRINRQWGQKYHSSIIDTPGYLSTCYRYIYRNPVAAGLSKTVVDYRFSSLAVLLGTQQSSVTFTDDIISAGRFDSTLSWLQSSDKDGDRERVRKSLKHAKMKFNVDRKSRKAVALDSRPF